MFGRHVEKERIINFLLHDGGDRPAGELGVLPIVGAIGSGKTTLVQHACDDDRVRGHFPAILFFNFSFTYAIAASGGAAAALRSKHVIGGDAELSRLNDDPLRWVKGNLQSTRFLAVFEDVDMRGKQRLEELLLKLRCTAQGSKVIFTTSNRRVSTPGTVEPILLKLLPRPEYWFFFKAHAFAGRDLEESPRLVTAGKAIARKLNGSFFGAKIVGGLLKEHPDPRFWCRVLRSNIGGLSLLGDGIGYIADLSENLLPDNVNVHRVTRSKVPFASQVELPRFQGLCEPRGPETGLAEDTGFVRVLLCKSVMPFYSTYYIASCTVGSGNSRYERAVVSSNFLLDDV
ncbi:disease resistance protein RGA2-like [Panicum miliaceum]|uniref:Disease resistance protein RGA2-like n=1 Tax=Panicum miliaceum TaxID=4540 RepID=A0A3L6SZE1_PANMI|nr:disease resistance protein RGA2-like [Panicum miliaceum]